MMVGGNNVKSAALKKAEGNRSKVKQSDLDEELELEAKGRGNLVVPPHLSPAERRVFRHVLDTAPLSILAGADQKLIESYAVAATAARDAAVAMTEEGTVLPSYGVVDGEMVVTGSRINPTFTVWLKASNHARLMGGELGLSPASRARLSSKPEKTVDPMGSLLGMDGEAGVPTTDTPQ